MGVMNRPKENPIQNEGIETMSIISSSDSEEDDVSSGRYTALPQDLPDNSPDQEESDSQKNSEDELDSKPDSTGFDQSTCLEVSELWNSENSRRTDIIMDSVKVEQIKSVMAGFKLPSTSIPPWAAQIPEEEWKQQLINKCHLLTKSSTIANY